MLTELIAYIHLGEIVNSATPVLSERSAIIASYALCGLPNFASIGIQLGGIGGIAPERMGDLADLSIRAVIGGSLAAFMTAPSRVFCSASDVLGWPRQSGYP